MEHNMSETGWRPEVAEIERRRQLRAEMGGPEGIARQHKRGKLTVRERIDRLGRTRAVSGSFTPSPARAPTRATN